MSDTDTCPVCGKRKIAGYVPRAGVYLERTCFHCWKSNPDDREMSKRNPARVGNRMKGRE